MPELHTAPALSRFAAFFHKALGNNFFTICPIIYHNSRHLVILKNNMPMPELHTAPALSRLCGIFLPNKDPSSNFQVK